MGIYKIAEIQESYNKKLISEEGKRGLHILNNMLGLSIKNPDAPVF